MGNCCCSVKGQVTKRVILKTEGLKKEEETKSCDKELIKTVDVKNAMKTLRIDDKKISIKVKDIIKTIPNDNIKTPIRMEQEIKDRNDLINDENSEVLKESQQYSKTELNIESRKENYLINEIKQYQMIENEEIHVIENKERLNKHNDGALGKFYKDQNKKIEKEEIPVIQNKEIQNLENEGVLKKMNLETNQVADKELENKEIQNLHDRHLFSKFNLENNLAIEMKEILVIEDEAIHNLNNEGALKKMNSRQHQKMEDEEFQDIENEAIQLKLRESLIKEDLGSCANNSQYDRTRLEYANESNFFESIYDNKNYLSPIMNRHFNNIKISNNSLLQMQAEDYEDNYAIGMPSSVSTIVEEVKIICFMCKKDYNDKQKIFPISYICGHSLCDGCQKNDLFNPNDDLLMTNKCLICRMSETKSDQVNSSEIKATISNYFNEIIPGCSNEHKLKFHFASSTKCTSCNSKNENYFLNCDNCKYNICIKQKCLPGLKFLDKNCPIGHELKWTSKIIKCAKCGEKRRNGLECKDCLVYNQCIDCSEFRYPIFVCPNNHPLHPTNENSLCIRCPFISNSCFECKECNYKLCKECIDTNMLDIYSLSKSHKFITHIPKFLSVASCTREKSIQLWDVKRPHRSKILISSETEMFKSIIKLNDLEFATISIKEKDDNTIKIWNISTGYCIKVISGHTAPIITLTKISDTIIASSSHDKTIRIWEISASNYKKKTKFEIFYASNHNFNCKTIIKTNTKTGCIIKYDYNYIITADGDVDIKLWNINTGKCVKKYKGHTFSVRRLIKLDRHTFASSSWDLSIKIWDIKSTECLHTLIGHSYSVTAFAKINENEFASGSRDNSILIWNWKSGECVRSMNGHDGSIRSIVDLKDSIIATGSKDNSIKVWDTLSGNYIRTFYGQGGYFDSLIKV